MKQTILTLCLATLLAGCGGKGNRAAQGTSGNPVIDGWYADPEAIIYDDTYWIYPTWSDVFENQVFFDCFSSKDLVTWTKHPAILDTTEVRWAKRAMWAPSVIRNEGHYYLFFGANDVHPGEVGGIGVAVSFVAAVLSQTDSWATISGNYAVLCFGFAAITLVFTQTGSAMPGTHHIMLPAGLAAVVGIGVWGPYGAFLGVVFGILGSLLGDFFGNTFNSHCDSHIDPPAFTIFILTSIISVLGAVL